MGLVQEQQLEAFGFMVKPIGRVLQRYARDWTSGKLGTGKRVMVKRQTRPE